MVRPKIRTYTIFRKKKRIEVSLSKVMKALCISVGNLMLISLSFACGAGNGNGHHAKSKSVHSSTGIDGSWYCHTISGPKVRAIDGNSDCYRSRERCEKYQGMAHKLDLQPSSCESQSEAFCFSADWPERQLETCMKTGEECERVFKLHKKKHPTVRMAGCTVQTNNMPPVGDVH